MRIAETALASKCEDDTTDEVREIPEEYQNRLVRINTLNCMRQGETVRNAQERTPNSCSMQHLWRQDCVNALKQTCF